MSQRADSDFLVIGAGPAGLGAALRLNEAGADWRLLEATDGFGGLSSSFVDSQGFTWDWGGHVLFSHYDCFDRAVDSVLAPDEWFVHQRESWIWVRNRFVPYPFQNNLHRLDPADRWACVKGLLDARSRLPSPPARRTFADWMLDTMGKGVTDLFLRPYNAKVWAYPAERMDSNWLQERVAVPDIEGVLRSICLGEDEVSWGPNRVFRFPAHGGTGAIWCRIGERLPGERVALGAQVAHVDPARHEVTASDGRRWHYRRLISTAPLDALIRMSPGVVDPTQANGLLFSSTHIVGVGVDGPTPAALATKNWMYFPESNSPYYRITVFSNYSPNNVAQPGRQWSLMAEISESPHRPVDAASLVQNTLRAMAEDRLIDPARHSIRTTVARRIPRAYPTPFLDRDSVLDPILARFEEREIYSRGRFGAWKYEVSNQDHAFAQGRECAQRLLANGGRELEPTLWKPNWVNSRRNP